MDNTEDSLSSACIFDIKRYAINDGPGIRTTIFMKGCPLRCVWCHNPESWSPHPQILYKKNKCIGCQTCVDICPEKAVILSSVGVSISNDCSLCGRCTAECPSMALEMCGHRWTMNSLMDEIEKERTIMEDSGGGVTLCGGEPFMHPKYTLQILQELGRRGFHRAVDTSLYADKDIVSRVASQCEILLIDLKLMESRKHQLYTGVPNKLILDNIRLVAEQGNNFAIRIPLIEGVNSDDDNIRQSAEFLHSLKPHNPNLTVHLLPYHDVGKDKHIRMGSQYNPSHFPMATPSEQAINRCARLLESKGLHVVVGG